MSKIIKANHLIIVRAKDSEQRDCSEETLTSESMEILYQEARMMVEELISSAKDKADKILYDAKAEADNILAGAHQEVEQIKATAYSGGFQEGKAAGLLDVQGLKKQANSIIKKAHSERKKILGEMESEIIEFAVKLAEKIIRNQISNKPEVAASIVQDLLAFVQDSTQITVKLSTVDYENLESRKEGFQSILNYGVLNLEPDCTLNRGDCIIVSETGIVAAKIDDQLEKLHDILREVTHGD